MRAPIGDVFGALLPAPRAGGGDLADFHLGEGGVHAKVRMGEVARGERISWSCVEGPQDWIGTEVTFELARDGVGDDARTVVKLSHRNWKRASDFMGDCSVQWATFLLHLKARLEMPEPDDLYVAVG